MEPIRSRRRSSYTLSAGFTLIELVVVIAIIGIITTIALVSQSSFNKSLILANTAYDIALTIRSAESFGLGSRAVAGSPSNAGYGVYFDSTSPDSFVLFADMGGTGCHSPLSGVTDALDTQPGDCIYTVGSDDQLIQTYTLGNGMTINDFCAYPTSGTGNCISSSNTDMSSLNVVFARPNPDVFVKIPNQLIYKYKSACISITSPQGGTRSIVIGSAGVISVSTASCPPSL